MAKEIYRRLQEQLDQYSIGFPATESGVELKILERLFTEEEAEMALRMSMALESPGEVAARLGKDPAQVGEILERMAGKGLLFRLRKGDEVKYCAIPFVVGIYEYQLKSLDEEFVKLSRQYMEEAFHKNFIAGTPPVLRTIPIKKTVVVSHNVAPYEDSREIVKGQKLIAVADCICRVERGMEGHECNKPKEVCFSFGASAQYYIDRGAGRGISVEEALAILDRCDEAGLVCQPANMINPGGMCNCCGDCCTILRMAKRYPRPVELFASNYFAAVDADACTGCETCVGRCQMEAIVMNDEGVAQINLDRCIGCGLCVTTCPGDAMRLEPKPEGERRTPPAKGKELFEQIAKKRGKSLIPLSMRG